MNELSEITSKGNLFSSSFLSTVLHVAFFSLFFIAQPSVPRFEGYPTLLPVELVNFGPVSFAAPEGAQATVEESASESPAVTEVPPPLEEPAEPEDSKAITVESAETKKEEEPKAEKPLGNTEPKKTEKRENEPQVEEAPATKEDSGASLGIGGEGMRLDVKEFPFSYYLAALRTRIQSNWDPPYQAARSSITRKALVFFKIQRDGTITNIALEKSSGDVLFDRAAQAAVMQANPLPPLPFDFPERALGVHFEFEQGL
ncbi:MAG TPA: TonB family protein [bacterium]